MELFLNYAAYREVADKYEWVRNANKSWEEVNKEAVDRVLNNPNHGNWTAMYADKTTEVTMVFNDYADRVQKMVFTFRVADVMVYQMFNACALMPVTIRSGYFLPPSSTSLLDTVAEDIMYDSSCHDTIVNGCDDVDTKTTEEEGYIPEIQALMKTLQVADKTALDGDISDLQDGLKKQHYITKFQDCFEYYVNKVDDFNSQISSKFADIVGTFSNFPVFTRSGDNKAYVDEHYSQVNISRIDDSALFDDEGLYGGDQGDAIYNQSGYWKDGTHIDFNEDLYAFVRSHKGFEKYTDKQIEEYFSKMNGQGCTYITAVNTILRAYEDNPEEFKKKYGFDLYDSNGELNYNMLFVDYYIYSDGKVFTDCSNAEESYRASIISYYRDHPEEFERDYGIKFFEGDPPYDKSDNATLTLEASNKVTELVAGKTINPDGTISTTTNGTSGSAQINRFESYLKAHNDQAITDTTYTQTLSMDEYERLTDEGYTIAVSAWYFNLYEEDGSRYNVNPVGGHSMVVTGVTADGRYEVSTWGKKLYLDPSEMDDEELMLLKVN